jgi:hypothetical protein
VESYSYNRRIKDPYEINPRYTGIPSRPRTGMTEKKKLNGIENAEKCNRVGLGCI